MKKLGGIIGIIGLAAHLVVAAWPIHTAEAAEFGGTDASRKDRWEVILSPQYTLAKNLGFTGGTTAKIDDTFGFGLQIGYNFNEHWNLAGVFSWSQPDYQAVVQPAAGNSSPARSISGTLQMNTFGAALTYHLLPGPLTPYLDTNLSGTYVNSDIAAGPPVAGCYYDPWFGYVCGTVQSTKSDTFLSYGIGGGLRWDVNRYVLLRAGVRQQWIDLSNTGTPGFTMFKLDLGFKF